MGNPFSKLPKGRKSRFSTPAVGAKVVRTELKADGEIVEREVKRDAAGRCPNCGRKLPLSAAERQRRSRANAAQRMRKSRRKRDEAI